MSTLRFAIRERGFINTKPISDSASAWKGQMFQVTIDPWNALLGKVHRTSSTTSNSPRFAPIVSTLRCFKKFKHIGTRIAIVPAAQHPWVDPAHISAEAGSQGQYVNPYDNANFWCVRRWIGDDFRIPDIVAGTGDDKEVLAHELDALYLSASEWRKLPLSRGWSTFVRPLKCSVDITGYGLMAYGQGPATNTGAGMIYPAVDGTAKTGVAQDENLFDPLLPSRRYRSRGWIPNPFAGFTWNNGVNSGNNAVSLTPTGAYADFPWFAAGAFPVSTSSGIVQDDNTVSAYANMARNVLLCPACLIRLPPAYNTQFYWTVYMKHYFAVAQPVLTLGTWTAANWKEHFTGNTVPFQTLSAGTDEFSTLPGLYALTKEERDTYDTCDEETVDADEEGIVP